jgi:hypothetical protein
MCCLLSIGSGRHNTPFPSIDFGEARWNILKRPNSAELLISPLDGNFDGQRRLATI